MGLAESFAARFGGSTRMGVKPAVLKRVTQGVRLPGAQSAGTNPTTTLHTCRAFVGTFEATQIDETTIKSSDRIICILAATISPATVPEIGDLVTINSIEYVIVGGGRDGMGVSTLAVPVLYSCHARGT